MANETHEILLNEALEALDGWTAMTLPEETARAIVRNRIEIVLAAREEPHIFKETGSGLYAMCECGRSGDDPIHDADRS